MDDLMLINGEEDVEKHLRDICTILIKFEKSINSNELLDLMLREFYVEFAAHLITLLVFSIDYIHLFSLRKLKDKKVCTIPQDVINHIKILHQRYNNYQLS